MLIDIKDAAKCLVENDNILILTHDSPDGDTLGGAFALCRALLGLGKRARVVNSSPIPQKYKYLMDGLPSGDFSEDFVVAVDIAAPGLLGPVLESYSDKIDLAIDHHESNSLRAEKMLLDAQAPAACEIVAAVIDEIGAEWDKGIANCIFTGLSTDTGCFRYNTTTANTYRTAARMIDYGADNGMINRVMFETKSKSSVKLQCLAMEEMQYHFGGKCTVAKITRDIYMRSGATEQETEAIPSLTIQIEGVLLGLTAKEKEDGSCKISVRSREGFNVGELCKKFGGGGHKQAAACSFSTGVDEAIEMVLKEIEKML